MIRITFSGVFLGLSGLLLLAACTGPDDDVGQITQAIVTMQEGIEDQRLSPVLEQLAEDFRTAQGRAHRDLAGLMLYHYRRYPHINVVTRNQTIRVNGEQAEVTLDAWVLGGETFIPERGQHYEVSMRWQKSDSGQWQLARIKWQRRAQ